MNKPHESVSSRRNLIETLSTGARELGIDLSEESAQRMIQYLQELRIWNQRHNLTAIDDMDKMVTHHLLDCLAILPLVRGKRICDIGSGAGLPGIPLALALPDLEVTLVESRAKKVTFLRHVINMTEATNIKAVQTRVEDFQPKELFDTIIARALAPLHELIALARSLLKPDGRIVAMKSVKVEQEIEQLNESDKASCQIEELTVPGLDARRCVVVIELKPLSPK